MGNYYTISIYVSNYHSAKTSVSCPVMLDSINNIACKNFMYDLFMGVYHYDSG